MDGGGTGVISDGSEQRMVPKDTMLKNDLRRPTLGEIGARASVFTLEGIKG